MRVSQVYNLPAKQGRLSFVDVHVDRDNRLFVDPFAIRTLQSDWGARCVGQIQSFFEELLAAIREKRHVAARRLLEVLREPNETRLGLSRGRPRGHALGPGRAEEIWLALSTSRAVRSGLLKDLEETALLVDGIRHDIVSDMTTVLIRPLLIEFTREICAQYEIATEEVVSGALWNPDDRVWLPSTEVDLPVAGGRRLILVPKVIVRRVPAYDVDDYFNNYVIADLTTREYEDPRSELVHLLKNGRRRVYKKEIIQQLASEGAKSASARITNNRPSLLEHFRRDKLQSPPTPLDDDDIANATGGSVERDCGNQADWLCGLKPGQDDANEFRDATLALLDCLFSPALGSGRTEVNVNEGRGRVDVRFTNWAPRRTFFGWVSGVAKIACGNIVVECKNYSDDPKNPEFAQVLLRLSHYDKLGFLICPHWIDRAAARARARDIRATQDRFVLPLDCGDVQRLLERRESDGTEAMHEELIEIFNGVFN
jgi:hypothetical protein